VARDRLRKAAGSLVVAGRAIDTGRRAPMCLYCQHDVDRFGGPAMAGSKLFAESPHSSTDGRCPEATDGHGSLRAGISYRRRPRRNDWWRRVLRSGAPAAPKSTDYHCAYDDVHGFIDSGDERRFLPNSKFSQITRKDRASHHGFLKTPGRFAGSIYPHDLCTDGLVRRHVETD